MFFKRSLSITSKLTLFYTLSTSAMLFMSGISLYALLTTDVERQDDKFLADEVQGLRSILKENADDPRALEEEINWEGNASKLLKYYVYVLDQDGKILNQTASLAKSGINRQVPFPEPFGVNEYPFDGIKWKAPNGTTYLLMSAWADVGTDGKDKRLLQLASDITDDEILLADYRKRLFLVLCGGVLVASIISAVIARGGLKPLKEITQSVQRISATQLHERIGREKWPRELSSLAHEFDLMLSRLEDSFGRLSQFSADLAHELRTPINRLMGETEVALSKTRTAEDYQEVLESNLEEYAILSRMIDSLLFLARAENPETVIEKTISEIRRETEVVMEYYDAVAREKGIHFVCSGNATLSADFGLFRRALSNLLSNAIQNSSPGSKIDILIENGKKDFVELKVRDYGSGISAEHLPKIFNRFYRADSSRSEYSQGMGLGLAIVKSIMKLHNGDVTIDSALAKGTTITLKFPA